MNIEKNNFIKENGCYFTELSNDKKIILKEIFDKYKNKEFKYATHTGYLSGYSNDLSYNELEQIKLDAIASGNIWQFWYYNPSLTFTQEEYEFFRTELTEILKEIYPSNVIEQFDIIRHISYTMYNKGCFIANHRDGGNNSSPLCNILIYLNDDYTEDCGGELVVEQNNLIQPKFGNVAFIDFYYNNPEHKVNTILSDVFERKAFITSIPRFQNDN